ncbi:Nucleolar GTP-binding protein 1 [Ascosphaera atra]|nr:Nucleolar GTP-binding protein 1 [Ascosphaera atra]
MKKYDKDDPERRKLERDLEAEAGGPGVYDYDMHKNYLLANDEWKQDRMPEIWNGKNIYDYVDPDIEAKLAALEEEEEKLEADGYYNDSGDESVEDVDEADTRMKADLIREKRALIRNESKMRKSLKNRAMIPRSAKARKASEMAEHLDKIGYDPSTAASRAKKARATARAARADGDMDVDMGDAMEVDDNPRAALHRAIKTARTTPSTNRLTDGIMSGTATGVTNPGEMRDKAERMARLSQKKLNRMARQGEADRHETVALEKHLFSGKRGMGKTQRR